METSDFSTPFLFTVDNEPPGVPTLLLPASGDIGSADTPFFEWTPSTGDIVDYRLQVTSADITAGPFVIDVVVPATGDPPGTGHQAVTPLPDNTYLWQVIAQDEGGLNTASSITQSFILDATPPGPPILAAPAPNEVVPTNRPTFAWLAPAGEPVKDYLLRATSGDINAGPFDINAVVTGDSLIQFRVPPGDSLADAVYQWRVVARDAASNTADSIPQAQAFTVDTTAPDPPALVLPVSGDLINDNTPLFEWTPSLGDVAFYRLRVTSGDINTAPLDIPDKVIPASTTSDQTTTPLADATYRWRVTASDGVGNTSDSEVRTFTLDTVDPPTPILRLPRSGDFINENLPFFEWSPSTDADSDLLVISPGNSSVLRYDRTTGAFIDAFVSAGSGGLADPQGLEFGPDGNLYVASQGSAQVLRYNGATGAFVDAFVAAGSGGLSSPPDVTFMPGAVDTYLLQVTSGDIDAGPFDIDVVVPATGDPGTRHQAVAPLNDGTYRWRVIARDAAGNTATSDPQTFTMDTDPPVPPVLLLPASGDLINDNTPLFDWEDPPATADVFGYLLAVTSGDLNQALLDLFGVGPGDPEEFDPFQLTGDVPGFDIFQPITGDPFTGVPPATQFQVPTGDELDDVTYQWRVIATDRAFNTASSITRSFTVDTTPPGQPKLVSPLNNAFLNANTPFFKWEPVTGDVFDYVLHVTSGDINAGPFDIDVVVAHPGTGHQAVAPLNDGVYQWQVIARDQVGNPRPYGIRTFTVDTIDPGAPALDLPADNAFLNTGGVFFDWDAAVDDVALAGYLLEVIISGNSFETGPFEVPSPFPASVTQFQIPPIGVLAENTYEWRVVAVDEAGNTADAVPRVFTVDITPPAPPVLVAPAPNALLNDSRPFFDWTDSPTPADVIDYRLLVVSGDIGAGVVFIDVVVDQAKTDFQTTADLPDGSYQWQVIAGDRALNTGASLIRDFRVDTTAPGIPNLQLPQNNAFLRTGAPFFQWQSASGDVVNYELRVVVSTGNIITGPFVIQEFVPDSTTQFQTTGGQALDDATYLWRVIARDLAGNPQQYGIRTFTVDTRAPTPAPALITPASGDFTNDNTPFFEWTPSTGDLDTGVFDYLLQVTSADTFNPHLDREVVIAHPGTGHQVAVLLADATYRWRVIARDRARNLTTSDIRTFTVDIVFPAPATLVTPVPNALLNSRTVDFVWTPSTSGDVKSQFFKVTTSDLPPQQVFDQELFFLVVPLGPAVNQHQVTLPEDGNYKWAVGSRDRADNETPSELRPFGVDTAPPAPAPTLVSPASGDQTNDNTPFFEWAPSTGDVFDYLLQVTSGGSFNPHLDLEVVVVHPGTGHEATVPLNDAVYQWRVIARDRATPEPNTASSLVSIFRVDTRTDPPTLLSPIGGRTIGDLRPIFRWDHSDPSPPVTYDVLITSDNSSPPFNQLFPDVGGLNFTPPADLPLGPAGTAEYFWSVRATDSAGTGNSADSVVGTFNINENRPGVPVIISPLDKSSDVPVLATFQWGGVALADEYELQIAVGDFTVTPQPIAITVPHIPTGDETAIQSHTLAQPLAPGTLHQWRVSGTDTDTTLTGDFIQPAAFITSGDPQDVTLRVALQGSGDIVGPVEFRVRLYDKDAFGPAIAGTPWRLFESTPVRTFTIEPQTGGVPQDRTFTLVLQDVTPGFYDITIEANHTLVNLRDDVPVHTGAGILDMGTKDGPNPQPLLEGNAIDDPRPGVEPASIVNALDASLLASAFGTSENNPEVVFQGDLKKFDRRADFNRDGRVNQVDFDLLKANFLIFSPVIVVP